LCCSVLQCIEECCSPTATACCIMLHNVAECCSVLQWVAAVWSSLWRISISCWIHSIAVYCMCTYIHKCVYIFCCSVLHVYMYIYICVQKCKYLCECVCTPTHIVQLKNHVPLSALGMRVPVDICMCVRIYAYTVHMYIIYVPIYWSSSSIITCYISSRNACTCIHIYVCMYIYMRKLCICTSYMYPYTDPRAQWSLLHQL